MSAPLLEVEDVGRQFVARRSVLGRPTSGGRNPRGLAKITSGLRRVAGDNPRLPAGNYGKDSLTNWNQCSRL
jgi:hypothetical protein